MCLAIPGRVKKIEGRKAVVDYVSEEREVMIGENGVKIGDYVMVQMGIIVKVISEEEAKSMIEAWKEVGGNDIVGDNG